MPTNTPKFNLIKPLKSEKYNVDQFNTNADTIDSQIYSKTEVDTALDGKANTTTTINNKALSSNIIINASDVPNTPTGNISATNVQNAINELDTEKANKVQEAWITPTLLNGWVNLSGFTTRYMKDEMGVVWVELLVTGATAGSLIFTLPVGYRPTQTLYPIGQASSLISGLIVATNGNVSHSFGTATSSYRYSFCFRT